VGYNDLKTIIVGDMIEFTDKSRGYQKLLVTKISKLHSNSDEIAFYGNALVFIPNSAGAKVLGPLIGVTDLWLKKREYNIIPSTKASKILYGK